jgi:vanillate O-demethylase ferredoxin subunit
MAQRLAADGADFVLHYCARSAERMAFAAELAAAPFAGCVHLHVDDGDPAQRLDAARLLAEPTPDTHLYVCGPSGFIEHVLGTAQGQGWDPAHVHREYFGAAPQATGADGRFDVRIASSGKTYTVAPDQSVVQALAPHGIEILTSCEQGVCGTCITRVLEGECDHRDLYFTDEEKAAHDQFTPCCSRARSAVLVLDL